MRKQPQQQYAADQFWHKGQRLFLYACDGLQQADNDTHNHHQ